jgi:hypothetical protein
VLRGGVPLIAAISALYPLNQEQFFLSNNQEQFVPLSTTVGLKR